MEVRSSKNFMKHTFIGDLCALFKQLKLVYGIDEDQIKNFFNLHFHNGFVKFKSCLQKMWQKIFD